MIAASAAGNDPLKKFETITLYLIITGRQQFEHSGGMFQFGGEFGSMNH
jgi:hypothetical protein